MENDIDKFLDYITYQKKYSDATISVYEHDVKELKGYLNKKKLNYKSLEYKDVTDYLIFLSDKKNASSSINRKLSSIRSFYNYLIAQNITLSNPFNQISGPKKSKKLPNYLQYNEFIDLVNACDDTPLGVRNRMILELLFASGIRVSEAVNIKIHDISFKEREIKVTGKGKKERVVYFNKVCQKVMSEYVLGARQELLKGKKCDYLLVNHLGNKLTRRGVGDIIEKLILKSSIKHKITPHTLRHTFATLLLNGGMDIREVQTLLGHENLNTTSIYTHISNENLRKVYLDSHPRAHKK